MDPAVGPVESDSHRAALVVVSAAVTGCGMQLLHCSNSSSLAISITSAVTFSTEILNLSKLSMRVRINFFQTSWMGWDGRGTSGS